MTQIAVSLEQVRRAALDQLRAGLSYPGVDLAWKYVCQCPEDAEVAGELVRGLNRLGLEALAAWLTRGRQGGKGALPWGKRASQWSANLRAMQARYPRLSAQLRQHWNSCRDAFELYQCADGNWQIRWVQGAGLGMWLPAFGDHKRAAEQMRPAEGSFAAGNCMMIYGVGPGWIINRACRETEKVFLDFSCCIHVLAPSAIELASAMHLHDWTAWLADRRVLLFVGPDCLDQQEQFLRANPLYPIPAWRITQPTWDVSRVDDIQRVQERIVQHRERKTQRLAAGLQARYEGRDVAWWAGRYARREAEPLRVMGIVSRHSTFIRGSTEHCLAALRELGCETRLVTEAEPFFLGHSARELHQVQLEFEPDLIFMVDNYRAQMPGSLTPQVPSLMWIQDALGRLICPEAGRAMGPLDFTMGYARTECVSECQYPADAFLECDVPTGFDAEAEVRPDLAERFGCDVSFVSTASKPLEQTHRERRAQAPPEQLPLIDAIYEEVCAYLKRGLHILNPKTFLQRMMQQTGVQVADVTERQDLETWYVFRLFDWGFRQEALRWTAEWARRTGRSFRIYGRGWEAFPGLEEFAAGHLWEREEVAAAHRFSRVNLQLFAHTALHQRTYDILGAGGLPLIRRTPADHRNAERSRIKAFLDEHTPRDMLLEEHAEVATLIQTHFGPPEEVVAQIERGEEPPMEFPEPDVVVRYPALREVIFDSADSLAERLDFYLGNEGAREAKAAELRESILTQSTYLARMRDAVDFVARGLRLRAKYGCRGLAPARGPEAPSDASVLVLRADWSGVPGGRYMEEIEEALSRGIARATRSCESVCLERGPFRERERRVLKLIEKHIPDLVVSLRQPLSGEARRVPARQLVVGYTFSGPLLDMSPPELIRFAPLVNATFPELFSGRSCGAWTGLDAEHVRGLWMPWEGERRAATGAECDLSVSVLKSAPADELLRRWMANPFGDDGVVRGALGRLGARREETLEDAASMTPARLDALYAAVVDDAEVPPGSRAARFLRFWYLPQLVEVWFLERWLHRLAGWSSERALRLCIAARDPWRACKPAGACVVPFDEIWESPVRARLHLGFSSAPYTPRPDLGAVASGTPTLLWRSPNWHAPGGDFCPTLRELCPDIDTLTFADFDDLTARIDAHLSAPAALTDATRAAADRLAAQLSPARLLPDLLRWALAD